MIREAFQPKTPVGVAGLYKSLEEIFARSARERHKGFRPPRPILSCWLTSEAIIENATVLSFDRIAGTVTLDLGMTATIRADQIERYTAAIAYRADSLGPPPTTADPVRYLAL